MSEERTEERTETHGVCLDTISRQAAISVIAKWMLEYGGEGEERERNALKQAAEEIKALPSAQPDSKELSFTQKKLDTISRKAAIRWVKTECNPYGKPTLDFESGKKVIEHLKQMPSAQPEPCVDTIDALDESIKHFDDMEEECRRNANIEQNDYMDMRDDAAEYRQLSIWLNELKWLRERFQSQPDSKETSPTHKALDTISRQDAIDAIGKVQWAKVRLMELPSAQPEIIRCKDCKWCKDADGLMCKNPASWVVATECDFGCVLAERRTDE